MIRTDVETLLAGRMIWLLRERRGVPQSQLRAALGRSQTFVSRLERGEASVDADRLPQLADALDVTRQDLSDLMDSAWARAEVSVPRIVGDMRAGEAWWEAVERVSGVAGLSGLATLFACLELRRWLGAPHA